MILGKQRRFDQIPPPFLRSAENQLPRHKRRHTDRHHLSPARIRLQRLEDLVPHPAGGIAPEQLVFIAPRRILRYLEEQIPRHGARDPDVVEREPGDDPVQDSGHVGGLRDVLAQQTEFEFILCTQHDIVHEGDDRIR